MRQNFFNYQGASRLGKWGKQLNYYFSFGNSERKVAKHPIASSESPHKQPKNVRSLSAIQALEKKLRPFSALLSNKTTACSVFVFSLLGENYSDVIGWNT